MSLNRKLHSRDEGAVAVVVAITSLVLIGVGALAVDIGNLYSVRRESQRSADLAALAGAQKLPSNPTQACKDALSYLDANKPGFDANNSTIPNPTGYKIDPATCGTSGTSDGKTVKISSDGLTMDVKVPDQEVSLGLAAVFGYGKGYTAAGATVQIRSPGHILPFALTLCRNLGFVTVKASSHTKGDCADAATGDFGFLNIPRTGVTGVNTRLQLNIDKGIDHSVAPYGSWPGSDPPDPFVDCDHVPVTDPPPIEDPVTPQGDSPVENANCLDISNGNAANEITKGLIESQNGNCDGRLTRRRAGSATATYAGCTIDDDPFARFLLTGTIAQATSLNPPAGAISQEILSSPNFFWVPVINTNEHPDNGYYPIKDFRGFYLECFDDGTGTLPVACPQGTTGTITRMQGYAFTVSALEDGVTPTGGDTNVYLGGGPKVPVLVK